MTSEAPEVAPAPIDDEIETRVDAAWAAAADDPSDAAAARFIDVILAEALICPIWDDLEGEPGQAPGQAPEQDPGDADGGAAGDAFAPKMVEIEGRDTLLLFDTEERLACFVEEPTSFVALPGHFFFETAAGQGAQIALNLDVAPSSTVFEPASVDAIAALLDGGDEIVDLLDPTNLAVTAPEGVAEATIAALAARLATAGELASEAWLFGIAADDAADDAIDRPVLALVGAADRSDATQELGRELARLAGSIDQDGVGVDVAVLTPDDAVLERIRSVGFGLLARD